MRDPGNEVSSSAAAWKFLYSFKIDCSFVKNCSSLLGTFLVAIIVINSFLFKVNLDNIFHSPFHLFAGTFTYPGNDCSRHNTSIRTTRACRGVPNSRPSSNKMQSFRTDSKQLANQPEIS